MLTRLEMIGAIREMVDGLHAADRSETCKEILGGLDRFNLAGVPDETIRQVWEELSRVADRPERCRYCRGDECAYACECV